MTTIFIMHLLNALQWMLLVKLGNRLNSDSAQVALVYIHFPCKGSVQSQLPNLLSSINLYNSFISSTDAIIFIGSDHITMSLTGPAQ